MPLALIDHQLLGRLDLLQQPVGVFDWTKLVALAGHHEVWAAQAGTDPMQGEALREAIELRLILIPRHVHEAQLERGGSSLEYRAAAGLVADECHGTPEDPVIGRRKLRRPVGAEADSVDSDALGIDRRV